MPLQTRLTDLLMGCYTQIALELKGRFNYTTRSAKKEISSTPLHPTPCTTLAALHSQVTTYRAPPPSLLRSLVATPSRRSRVCLSHLAASIQSSRVQTRRERERQSERNHWRCGAKYGKRTTRQPSIRASEKQAQAEVNPLSSSSITVATCECLLLRSLPRPPPSPPACTPCSSPNPSPSVGCLAARDRRFRCALTEFGPGFGLEAFDSCGCFPSAVWVQLVKLEAQICSAKRKLSDRMDDAVRASKRVRGVCVLRDCRHSLTDAY